MGVDWLEEAESDLKGILDDDDKFMSIQYKHGSWEIVSSERFQYESDEHEIVATGKTLTECIQNYRKNRP